MQGCSTLLGSALCRSALLTTLSSSRLFPKRSNQRQHQQTPIQEQQKINQYQQRQQHHLQQHQQHKSKQHTERQHKQLLIMDSQKLTFELLPERPNFSQEEERILRFWKERETFKNSLQQSKDRPPFTFYDGPPFATGLPHYGHILAGTIKDVVTRYAQQTGKHVERRFGWDCHGLPVEYEIDKAERITKRQQIIDMGIDIYNEKCRSIVQRYASEWKTIVERLGRWVDFEKGYKTMDATFMESVWWVFQQLFKKGFVYRGFTIMPYSTACSTPLSNFEANQNYKDVKDPSIVVSFPCTERDDFAGVEFLAWTTTPWTLPANLALCVNPSLTYVIVENSQKRKWVLCESRLDWLAKQLKMDPQQDFAIVQRLPGAALEGKHYTPPFDFFYHPNSPEDEATNKSNFSNSAFRILVDGFVSDDSGTGIVHCAPAFGEDDFRICTEQRVLESGGALPCPVDECGCLTSETGKELAGLYIKDADKVVKKLLKSADKLVLNSDCVHSYPHCWRSDTPLIYRAVRCWFIKVEPLRNRLVRNSDQTYWIPAFIRDKRFRNWLSEARDWCVSRNRFWGTPIPLWTSQDFSQVVCIGSKAELEKYAGRQLTDLHRHFVDDIEIPDPRGEDYPPLRRIPEVFDCWFESGSMPYGQLHYPFENIEKFEKAFPADFIGEGLDQTRGWFYTLMVLSTILFDKPPFKNLIVNGLVLAADGRKMSKRMKNYPDPMEVVHAHGADALRIYLVSSPVVRADTLRFRVEGVKDVVKDVILPWFHACRFFVQEAVRYENANSCSFIPCSPRELLVIGNAMDRWILSAAQSLVKFYHQEMQAYRLYTVVPRLLHFLEQLTNWYVRLNRDRMRGSAGEEEACVSLQTLYDVLLTTVLCMAALAPFTSELLYQTLKRALPKTHPLHAESLHFLLLPSAAEEALDTTIERRMARMQAVINLGRTLRERKGVSLKTPLRSLTVLHADPGYIEDLHCVDSYIKEELNVLEMEGSTDTSCIELSAVPNFKKLGVRVGNDMKELHAAVRQLTHEQLEQFAASGCLSILNGKYELMADDLLLHRTYKLSKENPHLLVEGDSSVLVLLDFTPDPSLQRKALAREVANKIQKMRKEKNLKQTDDVQMYAWSPDEDLHALLRSEKAYITKCLRRELLEGSLFAADKVEGQVLVNENVDVGGKPLNVVLVGRQN